MAAMSDRDTNSDAACNSENFNGMFLESAKTTINEMMEAEIPSDKISEVVRLYSDFIMTKTVDNTKKPDYNFRNMQSMFPGFGNFHRGTTSSGPTMQTPGQATTGDQQQSTLQNQASMPASGATMQTNNGKNDYSEVRAQLQRLEQQMQTTDVSLGRDFTTMSEALKKLDQGQKQFKREMIEKYKGLNYEQTAIKQPLEQEFPGKLGIVVGQASEEIQEMINKGDYPTGPNIATLIKYQMARQRRDEICQILSMRRVRKGYRRGEVQKRRGPGHVEGGGSSIQRRSLAQVQKHKDLREGLPQRVPQEPESTGPGHSKDHDERSLYETVWHQY